MKDMSVKELIVKCGVGWNDFKAELLRRFDDTKCCGNCKLYLECFQSCYYRICDNWQSDGLTRAEREGK